MAKRSPILGYNHNVRYRGLVFHVQTEDSGVLSPHLFTHLFHAGVIVSTRKLVYDSGSAEEAIKSLMQAQHKAVLKDLKRGHFDDKIDEYLGTTPGLLPRGAEDPGAGEAARASEPRLARPSDPQVPVEAPGDPSAPVAIEPEARVAIAKPAAFDATSLTTEPIPRIDLEAESSPVAVPPTPVAASPVPARVQTAERKSAPGAVRLTPAESIAAVDPRPGTQPPVTGIVEAVTAAVTTPTPVPVDEEDGDSGPEIEIQLELDEPDEAPAAPRTPGRSRTPRDTDLALPPSMQHLDEHNRPTIDVSQLSDGVPGIIGQVLASAERARTGGEAAIPPPLPEKRPSTAVGAASLPPARPITRPPARPPALTPPAIVARPLVTEDSRGNRRESDGVEVYSPPPAAAAAAEPGERPGVYSQHKKGVSQRIPTDIVGRAPIDRNAGVPIPPGLGRPGRPPSVPSPRPATAEPPPPPRAQRGDSARAEQLRAEQLRAEQLRAEAAARVEAARAEAAREALRAESAKTTLDARSQIVETIRESAAPREIRPETRPRVGPVAATPPEMPARARTPTPTRASSGSGPTHARAGTGNLPASGGVVMTRPAVIVGAPTKPASPPRVRRAREDEGRGFGQGLISEKSLDEVILAYLSEDSEDK